MKWQIWEPKTPGYTPRALAPAICRLEEQQIMDFPLLNGCNRTGLAPTFPPKKRDTRVTFPCRACLSWQYYGFDILLSTVEAQRGEYAWKLSIQSSLSDNDSKGKGHKHSHPRINHYCRNRPIPYKLCPILNHLVLQTAKLFRLSNIIPIQEAVKQSTRNKTTLAALLQKSRSLVFPGGTLLSAERLCALSWAAARTLRAETHEQDASSDLFQLLPASPLCNSNAWKPRAAADRHCIQCHLHQILPASLMQGYPRH